MARGLHKPLPIQKRLLQKFTWTIMDKSNELERYSSTLVKESVTASHQRYLAKLTDGQPSNWSCDQRTSDLFCIGQWVMEELLVNPKCSDEQRRDVQSYFNRNARGEEDLFELAARSMNLFLEGKIERYRGR